MERWATFDCYGTLIDWNGGVGRELERLFGAARVGELLSRYHDVERGLQRERPKASYREILTQTLPQLGHVPADEEDALARSLPSWQPFPEVPAALEDAKTRGWRLAILSNTDRDFIDASIENIGVDFELAGEFADADYTALGECGLGLRDLLVDCLHVSHGLDDIAGASLALCSDHSSALCDSSQRLTEVSAAADKGDTESALLNVTLVIGGGENLGLVDVVNTKSLEDLTLDKVADAGLCHDGDGDGFLDLLDHGGV